MTPDEIVARVAARHGVSRSRMHGIWKDKLISRARQEAMWLLRDATALSFPQIGAYVGGRDHSTVMFGVRKIARLITARPVYAEELRAIIAPERRVRTTGGHIACSGCRCAASHAIDAFGEARGAA